MGSVVCFCFWPCWCQRGITLPLLQAAVAFAAWRGARVVGGYLVDRPAGRLRLHMGQVTAFRKAGFAEVARRSPTSRIFRLFVKRPR